MNPGDCVKFSFLNLYVIFSYVILLFHFCTAHISVEDFNYTNKVPREYLVYSPQCKIAALDPFADDVMKLFKRRSEVKCANEKPLTYTYRNPETGSVFLLVDTVNLHFYNLTKDTISCCYQDIYRDNIKENSEDNPKYSKCHPFNHSIQLKRSSEFIFVHCVEQLDVEKTRYENVHVIVSEKKSVTDRLSKYKLGMFNNLKTPLSVLMMGIDSVSRLNFIRAMPKTHQYVIENGWFELQGYNKMGDNTFPNLMAVLSGYDPDKVTKVCKPNIYYGLNNCPLIWNDYRDSGYVTGYGEDESGMSTFNYLKKGFVYPPTDYYLRPAKIAADELLPLKKMDGLDLCNGFKYAADYVYQYGIDFAEYYKGTPYFGLFWTNSFSHNNFNEPTIMDSRMTDILQDMEHRGIFNESIVIFFSDHGMRFGPIRTTVSGWLEERLPFIYISLPQWFQKQNPSFVQALKINRNRLTSPYDLYLTLKHILKLSGRAPSNMTRAEGCSQCQSLFEEVPLNRTCESAGITSQWCTCVSFQDFDKTSKEVTLAAQKAVDYMNNEITKAETRNGKILCAKLELSSITNAQKTSNAADVNFILVRFITKPGNGEFESTVGYSNKTKTFSVSSSVSRLNIYGKTSSCVTDSELRKYCYCTNKINNFIN